MTRSMRRRHPWLLVLAAALLLPAGTARASVIYDYAGSCFQDCTPGGFVPGTVGSVTGFFELDIANPGDSWTLADVLDFSFTFDGLTVTATAFNINRSLFISPATSSPDDPLEIGNVYHVLGFLESSADHMALDIRALGDVRLVQADEKLDGLDMGLASSCADIPERLVCTTAIQGDFTVRGAMPMSEPGPFALFGLGLLVLGLLCLRLPGGRRRSD